MKKQIYICCKKEKWEEYKAQAESIYEDMVEVVTDKKDTIDLVLIIQPIYQEMSEDIQWTINDKMPTVYMTNRFIPVRLYEALLSDGDLPW